VSAGALTVTDMIHPWRRLRALTDVTLLWHDDGPMGETDFEANTISIRRGMTYEERRCTVLHEVLHVERGPVTMGMVGREELLVQKETARLMLPSVKAIGDAYAWAQGDDEGAAAELGVDVEVLRTRMKYMTHPTERGYLARRFEEDGERRL
jgi:hypothetical protein